MGSKQFLIALDEGGWLRRVYGKNPAVNETKRDQQHQLRSRQIYAPQEHSRTFRYNPLKILLNVFI